MARVPFGVEIGYAIYSENGDNPLVFILSGTAAPDGTSGEQGNAAIGSLYARSGTGELYQKVANAGNPADWLLNGSSSAVIGSWKDPVKVVTNDTVAVGVRDLTASPFADDQAPLLTASDFSIGDRVIADADGTPVIRVVTAVSSPNVTFAAGPALTTNDTFVADNYLPDPAGQENKAIVNYNGTIIVKLSDIDWALATGINLSGSYVAASGNVAANDTVEAAIAKLDGVNDNQDTLLGTAQGATDLGTFPGVTIPDSSTVKGALTSLETAHEEVDQNVNDLITLSGVAENSVSFGTFTGDSLADSQTSKQLFQRLEILLEQMRGVQATGITTLATVDSVPTASVKAVKWFVEAFEEATPANRKAIEVYALNNGTLVDNNTSSILKVGSNFNFETSVDVSGGNMRLRASSSTAGITVTARRVEVVKSVL